jgi:hypothetical protein
MELLLKKKPVKENRVKVYIEDLVVEGADKKMLCKFCGKGFIGKVYKRCVGYRVVRCSCCGKLLNITDKVWGEYKSV